MNTDLLRNVKNAPISFINIKKNVNEMKNVTMNGKPSVILSIQHRYEDGILCSIADLIFLS